MQQYVYERGYWSTEEITSLPDLYNSRFFLNVNNHLCLDGSVLDLESFMWSWEVWCLADRSTEWIRVPSFSTDQKQLTGTLPAGIIPSMVTTKRH